MKRLLNLSNTLLTLACLIIFMSCGSSSDPTPTVSTTEELKEQAKKLAAKTWNLATVMAPDEANTGWDGMTLGFTVNDAGTGGTYTIAGRKNVQGQVEGEQTFDRVWENGTFDWTFDENNKTKIKRANASNSSAVTIDAVSDTGLTLSFSVQVAGGRTTGVVGNWSFSFIPAS